MSTTLSRRGLPSLRWGGVRPFTLVLALAALVALAFLVIPILALFLRIPLSELIDQLDNQVVIDALIVTAKTNAHRLRGDAPGRDAGRLLHRARAGSRAAAW